MVMVRALIVCLLALGYTGLAWSAEFQASVDRTHIAQDEHVLLTLTLTNSDTRLRAVGIDPNVDLAQLTAQFDVGTPRDSNRYNLFRGRGRSTSEIVVELFPKRTGKLVIPAFTIEDLATTPITVDVVARTGENSPQTFLKSGISPTAPMQYAPMTAWLDVYHRVALTEAKLGGDLELEPTPLDTLEHRRHAVTMRKENIDGFEYDVMRTTWSVVPAQPGELKFFFPDVWIVTAADGRIRLPRANITTSVAAWPAGVSSDLLIGKPELTLAVTTSSHQVGQPMSLAVTLRTLSRRLSVPSELMLRAPPGLQVYSGAPRLDTSESVNGTEHIATYVYSIVASSLGDITGLEFGARYFDVASSQVEVASVTAPILSITEDSLEAATGSNTASDVPSTAAAVPSSASRGWQWGTVVFATLWLITLALLRRQRAAATTTTSQRDAKAKCVEPSTRALEAILLRAMNASSLDEGLTHFERRCGIDPEIRATVRAVQTYYYDTRTDTARPPISQRDVETIATRIRQQVERIDNTTRAAPWRFVSPLKQSQRK